MSTQQQIQPWKQASASSFPTISQTSPVVISATSLLPVAIWPCSLSPRVSLTLPYCPAPSPKTTGVHASAVLQDARSFHPAYSQLTPATIRRNARRRLHRVEDIVQTTPPPKHELASNTTPPRLHDAVCSILSAATCHAKPWVSCQVCACTSSDLPGTASLSYSLLKTLTQRVRLSAGSTYLYATCAFYPAFLDRIIVSLTSASVGQ